MYQGCDHKGHFLPKIYLISFVFISFISADPRVSFRIYPQKDTFLIGEPIILTLILKNVSSERVSIPYMATRDIENWTCAGFFYITITTPKGTTHPYSLPMSIFYSWPAPYHIPLLPKDSVYFRYFLLWQNFRYFRKLGIDKFEPGEYKLEAGLMFPSRERLLKGDEEIFDWECYGGYKAVSQIWAKKPKGKDLKVLTEVLKLVHPYPRMYRLEDREESRKIVEQLLIKKPPFELEHYLKYYLLKINIRDMVYYPKFYRQVNAAFQDFIKRYPDSPLTEEIIFLRHFAEMRRIVNVLGGKPDELLSEVERIPKLYPNNIMAPMVSVVYETKKGVPIENRRYGIKRKRKVE